MKKGYNYLVELKSGVCLFGTYERDIAGYRVIGGPLACFVPGIYSPLSSVSVVEFGPLGNIQCETDWLKENGIET